MEQDIRQIRESELDEGKILTCQHCPVRDVAYCAVLGPEERDRLEPALTRSRVAAGTSLATSESTAIESTVIVDGIAATYSVFGDGRRQILELTYPGAIVLPLTTEVHPPVIAWTLTRATVCSVDAMRLTRLRSENPDVGERILNEVNSRLSAAQKRLAQLGQARATEKIASFLLEMAEHHGRKMPGCWEILLPIRRREIADYLGMKMETVSRTLGALKATGAIDLPSPQMVLANDLSALRRLAAGFAFVPSPSVKPVAAA